MVVCVLLGNCSCIALISYIPVTMYKRHTLHPVNKKSAPPVRFEEISAEKLIIHEVPIV
jgi:hypothetical protein